MFILKINLSERQGYAKPTSNSNDINVLVYILKVCLLWILCVTVIEREGALYVVIAEEANRMNAAWNIASCQRGSFVEFQLSHRAATGEPSRPVMCPGEVGGI